jgi:hypothetical protein
LKLETPFKRDNISIHTLYLAFTNLNHIKQKESIGLYSVFGEHFNYTTKFASKEDNTMHVRFPK